MDEARGRDALVAAALFLVVGAAAAILLLASVRGPLGTSAAPEPERLSPPVERAAEPQGPADAAAPSPNSLELVSAGRAAEGGVYSAASSRQAPAARSAPEADSFADSGALFDQREFLRVHGAELRSYHAKLALITARFYARSPVVREVDRAFGALPRYMAVKSAYEQDGDPFKFGRDAISLPEVRAEIRRWLADPRAWNAAVGMIGDALKDPPSPAIYRAAQEFLGTPEMNDYLLQFNADASRHQAELRQAMSHADLAAFGKLAQDVSQGMSGAAKQ